MAHMFDSMPSRAIRAFVWDLADEGIDEVLEHLREIGIGGLHLALASRGGRFICPHNPKHAIVHAPEGALYFQPALACYEGVRPSVHPEYGSGAFAARALDAAHDYGLNFAAWINLFGNRTLSSVYPDLVGVNALGDRLEGALCPSNPAVRTYAQAMIEDLAHRVGVDVIELEDFSFLPLDAYPGPIWQQAEIGPWLAYLLSICFCEHCRSRAEEANIEVDDLELRVERMINSGLSGDLSDRRIGDEISDPYHPIARYAMTRCETVTSLLDELIDAASGSSAILQPILFEEPDDSWRWGLELHALRQRMMRATISTARTATETRAFVQRYEEVLQLGHEMAVDLSLRGLREGDGPALVSRVEACAQSGIDHLIFSHYGLAPLELLEWIGGLARR